jgi:hypothetical protein
MLAYYQQRFIFPSRGQHRVNERQQSIRPQPGFHSAVVADRTDPGCGLLGSNPRHYSRQSTLMAEQSQPCSPLPIVLQCIRRSLIILLIGVVVLSLLNLHRVEAAETEPSTTATPAAPSPESTSQPSPKVPPDTIEDTLCLKHRYPQDPTGARARLGTCRRGEHGQGGRHRRLHGGPWWNQP